jgi:Reverse transcriptase (RNA-dependent DNA polymerase)
LLAHHFKSSKADPSLFIISSFTHTLYILIYVDNIIITGSSASTIQDLMQSLATQFFNKDFSPLSCFLGIKLTHSGNALHLTKISYLESILLKANMRGAKSCTTPLQADSQLSKLDGTPLLDLALYRTIVSML